MAHVFLICGGICCGKTTYAHQLRRKEKAVLLSCDEVMLSLLDEQLGDRHEVYAARTEKLLLEKSLEILETGISVILDWGPWTRAGRKRIREFYEVRGYDCRIHTIRTEAAEWEERIKCRNRESDEGLCLAYHVDEGLKNKFLSHYEEPGLDETDVWVKT